MISTQRGFFRVFSRNLKTWPAILLFSLSSFSHAATTPFRVGVVLDKGGKDDKSFNQAAYRGATEATQVLTKQGKTVELKTVEATDDNAFETQLRWFAEKKYDLIIGIGVSQAAAVKSVSAKNPSLKFAIVDAEIQAPNVRSLLFEEHQGSYLMGAIAALSTKTGSIGFIGGMDIPLIHRFQDGYEAGAKKIKPDVKIAVNYIGTTGDAWNNVPKAKEFATSQYQSKNVDIIFGVAGASNNGVFDAAEQLKKFAIGVDSNQNWVKPGRILTSMLKKVDLAVSQTIQDAFVGKFSAKVVRYGLKDNGVDFAMDQYNEKLLSRDTIQKVKQLKAEIVAGTLKVPDYYLTNAAKTGK